VSSSIGCEVGKTVNGQGWKRTIAWLFGYCRLTIRDERYAHLRCAFLPSSNRARVSGKLVHFQLPRGGQFQLPPTYKKLVKTS
jgi:hypothetical protein